MQYTQQLGYDLSNNVDSISEQVGSTRYATQYVYDKDNKLVETHAGGGTTGYYAYDSYLRPSAYNTVENGVQRQRADIGYRVAANGYATGQVETWRNRSFTGVTSYDKTYTYAYDANGNITNITESANTGSKAVAYVYDEIGQLIRENSQKENRTYTYTYDDAGLRTQKQVNGAATATYTYAGSSLVHMTVGSTDMHIQYDGNGKASVLTYNLELLNPTTLEQMLIRHVIEAKVEERMAHARMIDAGITMDDAMKELVS
ncbi:hypothetical protein LJB83_01605 [Clostridia bacterium OttesenSCG-928-F22]|nr:hypothetical protein [Clostridia bacterium OttesenSCG-928-F22]